MAKSRVLKAEHHPIFTIDLYVVPEPNQEKMRQEFARLVAEGLQGVVNVSGHLRVTIQYTPGKRRKE